MELCERLYEEWGVRDHARGMCRAAAVLLLLCVLSAVVCERPAYKDHTCGRTGNAGMGKEWASGLPEMKVREMADVMAGSGTDDTAGSKDSGDENSRSEYKAAVKWSMERKVSVPGTAKAEYSMPVPGTAEGENELTVSGTAEETKTVEPGIAADIPTELPEGTQGSMADNMTPDETAPQAPTADSGAAENEGGEENMTGEESGTAGGTLIINGFMVDKNGMVCGIENAEAAVSGGVMTLPAEGCTGIKRGAFLDISDSVYEIHIPSNITYIEEGAFSGLGQAEWFEADAGNSAYYSEDGVLFSEGGACLFAFPAARTGIYAIPSEVTRLAGDAFTGSMLEKLITTDCNLTDTGNLPENIVVL